MTLLVPVALFGWIPLILLLFALLPSRRAVAVSFVAGWLLLPMAGYGIPGLPDYTKMTATSVGVLIGVVLFDAGRLFAFRVRLIDLPMVVWCTCPFVSSVVNGLGAYDGFSSVLYQTERWGVPYFIGRLYFSDLEGLRELALGIFVGGLAYVPLCLYEIRMSPQLHEMVYGFHQHSFDQTMRFGGWRPTVFLQHGLMVAMWMTSGSVVGVWLWRSGSLTRLGRVPVWAILPFQVGTTILCKSLGALILLAAGLGLLFLNRFRVLAILAVAAPAIYMVVRIEGWYPQVIIDAIARISEGHAGSLEFRVTQERFLIERALDQPLFGWGAHDRNRIFDEEGRDRSVTDSLWIITVGQKGLVGLAALTASLLAGVAGILIGTRPVHWAHPSLAPAVGLSVVVLLFTCDCLLNGMINPVYTLAAGGLAGTVGCQKTLRARPHAAERTVAA
jgi:hypothetical protein